MSQHFTIAEFCASDTAARRGIVNDLPPELLQTAMQTLEMMERIRAHLSSLAGRDVPILITSGYRGPALNAAVGSASTSDHLLAAAVDWKAPSFGSPLTVCKALAPAVSVLGIGQLLMEFSAWTHTSTRVPARAINRILTIDRLGTYPGIKG